jgi:hypothetical protein
MFAMKFSAVRNPKERWLMDLILLALRRNSMKCKQGRLSGTARFRYTQRFERQRPNETPWMAGLSSLPA